MRCFLISSLLLVAFARDAVADRKISDAAKAELERGEERFRQKDYAGAIAAFDAGYALDPQPIFLYDKAQAQRLAGDCATAIDTYKQFLATQPPDKEAIRARKNIATCEALSPPPSEEPAVEPSPPAAREQPEPAKRAPIVQREQRAWWSDGVGMTLLTSGLIGVGVGTGFAVAAGSAADDTALATNTDEWSAAHDRWQRNRMIAAIALGTGGALVISGVLRLSLRDRNVAVTPHGSGAMVSLGGAW